MNAWIRCGAAVVLFATAGLASAWLHRGPAPVKLTLEPQEVPECSTPVATRVEWDAAAAGATGVKLEVHNLGRPAKLWTQGGPAGSAEGGAWAHDGYTVTLKDSHGRVLARRTLTTQPCAS